MAQGPGPSRRRHGPSRPHSRLECRMQGLRVYVYVPDPKFCSEASFCVLVTFAPIGWSYWWIHRLLGSRSAVRVWSSEAAHPL